MLHPVRVLLAAVTLALACMARSSGLDDIDPAPTAHDWEAIAKLPDWSGVWVPETEDQGAREKSNPPPWKPLVAERIAHLHAHPGIGRPDEAAAHCGPPGMPSWMLISQAPFEVLFTPGRITLLGAGDCNRVRRIHTDGRGHPDQPHASFAGDSIGHWQKDKLVIDTQSVLPEAWLAVSETVGVPNDGDMHIVEQLHLKGPDTLVDELEITANRLLTKSWATTRIYHRRRAREDEIG